jgi:hypothetical protein
LIDADTGVPYLLPVETMGEASFRPDSRLFETDPASCSGLQCNEHSALYVIEKGDYTAYYVWDGHSLVEIYDTWDELEKLHGPVPVMETSAPPAAPAQK